MKPTFAEIRGRAVCRRLSQGMGTAIHSANYFDVKSYSARLSGEAKGGCKRQLADPAPGKVRATASFHVFSFPRLSLRVQVPHSRSTQASEAVHDGDLGAGFNLCHITL